MRSWIRSKQNQPEFLSLRSLGVLCKLGVQFGVPKGIPSRAGQWANRSLNLALVSSTMAKKTKGMQFVSQMHDNVTTATKIHDHPMLNAKRKCKYVDTTLQRSVGCLRQTNNESQWFNWNGKCVISTTTANPCQSTHVAFVLVETTWRTCAACWSSKVACRFSKLFIFASQTQQTQSGQKIHGWIRDSLSDLSSWIIMDYGSGIAMDSLSPPQTLHPGSRQLVQWRSRPIGRSAHFTEWHPQWARKKGTVHDGSQVVSTTQWPMFRLIQETLDSWRFGKKIMVWCHRPTPNGGFHGRNYS